MKFKCAEPGCNATAEYKDIDALVKDEKWEWWSWEEFYCPKHTGDRVNPIGGEKMKKIKEEKTLFIGEDIDVYMKSKELDDGRVKMTVDFDLKTERVKKIFENNPKLIKKAILKLMPPSMRLKSKLGGYPKIRVTDEDENEEDKACTD